MIKKISNKKYKTKYVGYDKKNGTKHKNNKTLIKRRIHKSGKKTTYKLRGGKNPTYDEINKCLLDVKQVNDLYVYSDELYNTFIKYKKKYCKFDIKFKTNFFTHKERLELSHESVKQKPLYTNRKDRLAVFESDVTVKLIKTIQSILKNANNNIKDDDKTILEKTGKEIMIPGTNKQNVSTYSTILSNLAKIIYNNFIQNLNTTDATQTQTTAYLDFRTKLQKNLRHPTPIIPYPKFSFFGNSQTDKALLDYLIEYTIFKCITLKLVSFFLSKIYDDPITQYKTTDETEVFTFSVNTNETYIIKFDTLNNDIYIYTLNKNTEATVMKLVAPNNKIPRYNMMHLCAFNMLSSYTADAYTDDAYCDIKYITIYNSGWSSTYYLTRAIANANNNTESKDAYTATYGTESKTDQQNTNNTNNTNNTIYYFNNVIEAGSNKEDSQYKKPEYTDIGDALFSVSITLYDTLKLEHIWTTDYITVYSTGYQSMYDTKQKKMMFTNKSGSGVSTSTNANIDTYQWDEQVPSELGYPVMCISNTALRRLKFALKNKFYSSGTSYSTDIRHSALHADTKSSGSGSGYIPYNQGLAAAARAEADISETAYAQQDGQYSPRRYGTLNSYLSSTSNASVV